MIKLTSLTVFWLIWTLTSSFEFSALDSTQFKRIIGKASASLGSSVSRIGDVNKDGFQDFIVGASNLNTVYVFYGGKNVPSSDIDLATPSFSGFTITGSAGESFGASVGSAGDLNKDGYDDIIVGAPTNNGKGAAYIIYGGQNLQDIDLGSTPLSPSSTGFMIKANAPNDYFGGSVSTAGDMNKDGYVDLVIGAANKYGTKGVVYVVYGRPSLQNIDLSTTNLDSALTGFMIFGQDSYNTFGNSVSYVGDVNKDGFDDIIIGAPLKDSLKGAAYVVYGSSNPSHIYLSNAPLNPLTTGFMISGSSPQAQLGNSVSDAGDINNDGYADVIVSAPNQDSNKGAVYVIYGGPKSSLQNLDFSTTTLDPLTTGFTIFGNAAGDRLGISVSNAGDLNGDNYGDIIVGASGKASAKGIAYVIYGGPKSSNDNIDLSVIIEPPFPTKGFAITGEIAGGYFGSAVSVAGDINGDGKPELVIGASTGSSNKGAAYIIYPSNFCGAHCESCQMPSICDTCSQGYILDSLTTKCVGCNLGQYSSSNQCKDCPEGCSECTSWTDCQACSSGYIMMGAQCELCPSGAYLLGRICESCPIGCSRCTSASECQACIGGYTLSGTSLLCVVKPKEEQDEVPEENGSRAVLEGTSIVGASLSPGSSLPINFGLVAKIIRNLKYLNVTVSGELQKTFMSWKVASGFLSAPKSWKSKYESKTLPGVFSRYKLDPVFLINYWKPFVMTLIGFGLFLLFKFLEWKVNKSQNTRLKTFARQINISASNFALTQFYSSLDDAIFYIVVDLRSTEWRTGFGIASCFLAVFMLVLGVLTLGAHSYLLLHYQSLKEGKSKTLFDAFTKKYENVKVIFKDFKDLSLFTQSFMLLNLVRSILASLVFATLFEYPLMQIILLLILNIGMILFLFSKRSFKEILDTIGQLFCELILLIANICMLIMCVFDRNETELDNLKTIEKLSKCIIILNLILLIGCVVLLVLGIGRTLWKVYQEKKKPNKEVSLPQTVNTRLNILEFNQQRTAANGGGNGYKIAIKGSDGTKSDLQGHYPQRNIWEQQQNSNLTSNSFYEDSIDTSNGNLLSIHTPFSLAPALESGVSKSKRGRIKMPEGTTLKGYVEYLKRENNPIDNSGIINQDPSLTVETATLESFDSGKRTGDLRRRRRERVNYNDARGRVLKK